MHPNPIFRKTAEKRALDFVRRRAFGQLSMNGPNGPIAAHVPVLLSDDGMTVEMHLVRSNPLARSLDRTEQPVLLSVTGPDGYVSPDWYGMPDQVPTWNYVAVALRGTLAQLGPEHLHDILDRQSAYFETQLPKPPWTSDKMDQSVLNKMMRQIVPCRMTVTDVQSTFKLSQNKPDAARLSAADAIGAGGIGQQLDDLAALMRDPPEQPRGS